MSHAEVGLTGAIVFIKENQVLLIKRKNTGYRDGNWGLPAGRIDQGETIRDGAIREAAEEVGIKITVNDLERQMIAHYAFSKDGRGLINYVGLCKKWKGDPLNMEPDKCEKIKWFELNKLPLNISKGSKSVIENILKGNTYAEIGFE